LSEKTAQAIKDYLEARGKPAKGPLFANVDRARKGSGRLTSQAVYVLVRDIFKRSDIAKPMSPHRIRHSAITAALELTNGNVRLVQDFSRHAKLETLQVYDDNRHKGQAQVTELLATVV
jgi:integrase/recombinase XerC